MAAQQQPGGPMMPQQAGMQQAATLQQQQLTQQQDFDPVHRFKMLIPQLKKSLQVYMFVCDLELTSGTETLLTP